MGYNSHNSAAFLIALILFSAANPLAHGLIPNIIGSIPGFFPWIFPPSPNPSPNHHPPGHPHSPNHQPPGHPPPPITIPPVPPLTTPNLSLITGSLCCRPTGTCPGDPLSGVLVRVNCISVSGLDVFVGQNRTDISGNFNISIPNIIRVVPSTRGQFPCVVTVQLPLNQTVCPDLSTADGNLVGIVGLITTLVDQVLGVIQRITIIAFLGIGI